MPSEKKPLWFKGQQVEDWVTRFTVGDDYLWDAMLLPYDIRATLAHGHGLVRAGILGGGEFDRAVTALKDLLELVAAGEITIEPEDEDSHTVIERYLTAEAGVVGKKIHTGRSRNDQVLAALRMFLREQTETIVGLVIDITESLCKTAAEHQDTVMPGYTHMQHAMPNTAGLWAAGYAELLAGDIDTLREAHRHVNVSPLGSAAGYGVPFVELPRAEVAELLHFDRIQTNVTAVQLSRGKIEMQVVHACVQVAATMNRLAADLVLYSATEFGFVTLPDKFTTGSSIMPHKRNPDVLELVRATYHRLVADMHFLATLPANLPSGYHRDLQLTKEVVMRAVTVTLEQLTVARGVLPGVSWNEDRMRAACGSELLATAHAMRQVLDGVPFREAYRVAAESRGAGEVMPDDLSTQYLVDGFPGRAAIEPIRERLEQHRSWLSSRMGES